MPCLSPEGWEEVHWRKGQEKEQDIWYPGSGGTARSRNDISAEPECEVWGWKDESWEREASDDVGHCALQFGAASGHSQLLDT